MDTRYPLAELLENDAFRAWVYSDGKEHTAYWQKWIDDHPGQQAVVAQAKMILQQLREEKEPLPEERRNRLRQKVINMARTGPNPEVDTPPPTAKQQSGVQWVWMAAAVLILIVAGGVFYWLTEQRTPGIQYHTAYGEIRTVILPDSTRVTLNGNSSLRYSYQPTQPGAREVWLLGEGFFDVNPLGTDRSQAVGFVVHTDNLTVKVLGTRFNVKHRREKTQVVLEEGSIQLAIDQRDEALLMQPDELVEVQKGEKRIDQKTVAAGDYIAWKEGVLHFDGASFEDISSILKDNYGLVLHFTRQEEAEGINLRGSFPTQNIDILLEAIANITHTSMKKKGKTIVYQ